MEDQLTRRTLHGVSWSYATTVGTIVVQLGSTAVLARALGPAAFGLIAMANIALRFGQYFSQMGVAQAIVQRKVLEVQHLRAGFWLSSVTSAVVAFVFMLAAPLLAALFRQPDLTPVLRVLSLGFVISGVGAVGIALIRRELRFRALAFVELGSYFLGYGIVGIACAIAGWGVWSLVAASLSQSLVGSLSALVISRSPIRPVAERRYYVDLLTFGSVVSLTTFVEFGCANLDTFVVGRILGSAAVGLYSRALNTASLPLQYIGTGMSKTLLPAFAMVQDARHRLVPSFRVATTIFAGLGFTVAAGVSFASPQIVEILLGGGWLAAIPVMRVASVAAAAAIVNHLFGVMLESQGAVGLKLRIRGIQFVWFAVLLLVLGRFGLVGYASAFAISEVSLNAMLLVAVRRTIGVPVRDVLSDYMPGVVGAALSAALIGTASFLGPRYGLSTAATFVVELACGAAALAGAALRFRSGQLWLAISGVLLVASNGGALSRVVQLGDRWRGGSRR